MPHLHGAVLRRGPHGRPSAGDCSQRPVLGLAGGGAGVLHADRDAGREVSSCSGSGLGLGYVSGWSGGLCNARINKSNHPTHPHSNRYRCENACRNTLQPAKRRFLLGRVPPLLCIQLKRFSFFSAWGRNDRIMGGNGMRISVCTEWINSCACPITLSTHNRPHTLLTNSRPHQQLPTGHLGSKLSHAVEFPPRIDFTPHCSLKYVRGLRFGLCIGMDVSYRTMDGGCGCGCAYSTRTPTHTHIHIHLYRRSRRAC